MHLTCAFAGIPTGVGSWSFWVSGSPTGVKLKLNPVLFRSGSGQTCRCKITPESKPKPIGLKTRGSSKTRN
jgi:hypothetical protein